MNSACMKKTFCHIFDRLGFAKIKKKRLVNSADKRVEFCRLNSVRTLKVIQLVLLRNRKQKVVTPAMYFNEINKEI